MRLLSISVIIVIAVIVCVCVIVLTQASKSTINIPRSREVVIENKQKETRKPKVLTRSVSISPPSIQPKTDHEQVQLNILPKHFSLRSVDKNNWLTKDYVWTNVYDDRCVFAWRKTVYKPFRKHMQGLTDNVLSVGCIDVWPNSEAPTRSFVPPLQLSITNVHGHTISVKTAQKGTEEPSYFEAELVKEK